MSGLPRILAAIAVAGAAAVGACADTGSQSGTPALGVQGGAPNEPRTYRLGIGDKVRVVVFGEPDLSGTLEINVAGQIAMPLVGDIAAKGLSPTALRELIARRLSDGYLKSPKVSVEVLIYRPIFVHGEVKSGGEFAFKNGMRLRDAIAVAGGYTYRAQQGYVLLTRAEDPREVRVDLPSTVIVMPGDNIRIPERFF
jgi:polysaccharide export outer membrane protein